jgi:Flp pilus assembly pilin Flp
MLSTRRRIARALADKRGLAAVEYTVMASAAGAVLLAFYGTFFDRVVALVDALTIP